MSFQSQVDHPTQISNMARITFSHNPVDKSSKNKHPCTWPGCQRLFACPHNVKQHIMEKHTLERPHVCEKCADAGKTKAFARPFLLNRHQRQIHHMIINTDRARKKSRNRSTLLHEPARCDSPVNLRNQLSEHPSPEAELAMSLLQQPSIESGWLFPDATVPTGTYGQRFDEMKIEGNLHIHMAYHLPTASDSSFGSWGQAKATGDAYPGGLPLPAVYTYGLQQHPYADHILGLAAASNTITSQQGPHSNVTFAWTEYPSTDATPGLPHSRTNSSISGCSPGTTMTDDLFSYSPDDSSWM